METLADLYRHGKIKQRKARRLSRKQSRERERRNKKVKRNRVRGEKNVVREKEIFTS